MTKTRIPQAVLLNIALDRILPSSANPRMTLDKEALHELKKSIAGNGLLQPIAVRVAGDNFEIVGGHRRFHAVRELAREFPDDPRFATIAALVVDLADTRVAAARLAENINRADLSPLEIAEGIADALENGMNEEELADSLGWAKRNVYRYRQFHNAPAWLKAFASAVPSASKKLDERGLPVLNPVTEAPEHDVERLPGLAFTHVFQLLMLYNALHEQDAIDLAERGGDKFRPRAESTVRKLARSVAKEQWSIAKLRAEIARIENPAPKTPASRKPAFTITSKSAAIDFTRRNLAPAQRDDLAAQLTAALVEFGFKTVVISDAAQ